MPDEIIKQYGKVRLIKSAGKYSVQGQVGFLFWKRWKNITFGPWYPMKPGHSRFTIYEIAEELYEECLPGGQYTQEAFHWKRGVR